MNEIFTDTSALVALLFEEPGSFEIRRLFATLDQVYASNLLEAEVRGAAVREDVGQREVDSFLAKVKWVLPERPLSQELRAVSSCGVHLKGADAWHLACALYLAGDPSLLPFLTLDGDQAEAATRLGFKVLPGTSLRGSPARETQAVYQTGASKGKKK